MRYLPPANIDDFDRSPHSDALYLKWHNLVAEQIESYRSLPRFLDPLEADDTAAIESIPWQGFPLAFDSWLDVENRPDQIERAHRSAEILGRFIYVKLDGDYLRVPAAPESGLMLVPQRGGGPALDEAFALPARPQDEYLEWHLVRDPATNAVTRIDFTAEAPEYWEALAEGDPALAAELYSDLLKRPVPREDLFFNADILCPELERTANGIEFVGYARLYQDDPDFNAGQYNRWNRWTTTDGAVHLTHRANTLFAEINLAANATRRFAARPDIGAAVDRFSLAACGGYGAVNRNSDPTIGMAVNSLALSGMRAMVSNPIGLYIGELDLSGFRDPDGNAVDEDAILTVHRGTFDSGDGLARVLRFSVHPPAGADYTLDRCTFDGHRLTTGGPIARKTTVIIHGVAMPAESDNPLKNCREKACAHPTKRPRYFVNVPAGASCPPVTDDIWSDPPAEIAPPLSAVFASSPAGPPRSTGSRS